MTEGNNKDNSKANDEKTDELIAKLEQEKIKYIES